MARLPLWVAALWWGSLSTIGFAVVPMLFTHLPTPAMAGAIAAKLFAAQTWVSVACGLLLLMISRLNLPSAYKMRIHATIIFVVSGMLLALLSEFAVASRIVARDNLRLWHTVGSIMYVLQWGCAAVTFSKLMPPTHPIHQV
jgi:hypothetical protein